MEEKSELNDIILNRGTSSSKNKKLLLSIGIFAILLVVMVVIFSSLSPSNSNLPQAVLPPEPIQTQEVITDDPLFESVEVIDETVEADNSAIEKITRKIKEESLKEEIIEDPIVESIQTEEVVVVEEPIKATPKQRPKFPKTVAKTTSTPKTVTKPQTTSRAKAVQKGNYYVQVGSFTKYKPDAKFLKSIEKSGFSYSFHKVQSAGKSFNKVLVGPFETESKARKALKTIRKNVINGAFLTKV